MDWSALPPDELTQLDVVKKILAAKELSDHETSAKNIANLLFKQNNEAVEEFTKSKVKEPVINEDCIEEVLIDDDEEEEHDIEIIDEPPSKHAKLSCEKPQCNDVSINGNKFADILENGGNLKEAIEKMSQTPNENVKSILELASSLISEKGLLNLTEFIINNTMDSNHFLSFNHHLLSNCLAPSITRVETMSRGLRENLENILERVPEAVHFVTTAALVANKHADFCLDVLQPLASETQIKRILVCWVPKVQMNESTLGFLERLLNMGPRVLEDSEVISAIFSGLSKEAEGQSSSPKFGKFLLFLIKNLPNAVSRENYERIVAIVGKNKTFLKKAMENNLKKRTITG